MTASDPLNGSTDANSTLTKAHEALQTAMLPGIEIRPLRGGVAMACTSGCNMGVFQGPDGIILVDSSFANQLPGVLEALSPKPIEPIRMLINTHWHHDHIGGNRHLAELGIPIVAHSNTRLRMATEQFLTPLSLKIPPSDKRALPQVTFDSNMTFRFNGDVMKLIHLPHSHTDGDIVVKWEEANILLANDFFVPEEDLPFVDADSGGNFNGYIDAVGSLVGYCDEDTLIIPGHARHVARLTDLRAFHEQLVELRDITADALSAGKTRKEIDALQLYKPYYRGGLFHPDKFLDMLVACLSTVTAPGATTVARTQTSTEKGD